MAKSNVGTVTFPRVFGRKVEVDFNGGHISSDGGVVLLGQIDRELGLTTAVSRVFPDHRYQPFVDHPLLHLLRQRVYGLCCGYEDLNDHQDLRYDLAFQTAVGTDKRMAGDSTFCRLENSALADHAWVIHGILVDQFIASYKRPPKKLVLDFDATDAPVHGHQEGRFFHGYYDHYCFLPLYVFCGNQLLVSYLRPSRNDAAKHAWGVLALLVRRLRQAWPGVKIVFRGDSGFCRHRMLSWCERNDVSYIVGLARNRVLERNAEALQQKAEDAYEKTGEKQRLFGEFEYGAKSWQKKRRVIMRIEHGVKGRNPRFVVTNMPGDNKTLYEDDYCARGDMENRIKEQQLDLFAARASCHDWWANQLRLLWSALAYVLMERLRALYLRNTQFAKAQCGTIRIKLLKIGAIVLRNTRRVRLHLSSACPSQETFMLIAHRLARQ